MWIDQSVSDDDDVFVVWLFVCRGMVFVRFIYDYLPPSGRGTDVLRVILVDGGCRWVPWVQARYSLIRSLAGVLECVSWSFFFFSWLTCLSLLLPHLLPVPPSLVSPGETPPRALRCTSSLI